MVTKSQEMFRISRKIQKTENYADDECSDYSETTPAENQPISRFSAADGMLTIPLMC